MGSKLAAGLLLGVCGVGFVNAGEIYANFKLQKQTKYYLSGFLLVLLSRLITL